MNCPTPKPCATPAQRAAIVVTCIAEVLGVDPGTIDDAKSIEDLGGDTLDAVDRAIDVEHAFDRPIDLDEHQDLATVGTLIAAVEREWAK